MKPGSGMLQNGCSPTWKKCSEWESGISLGSALVSVFWPHLEFSFT